MPVTAPTTTPTGTTPSIPAAPSVRSSSRAPSTTTSTGSARRAGLSEQAAVTAIEAACRTLHLPTIRDRAPDAITKLLSWMVLCARSDTTKDIEIWSCATS